MEAGPLSRMLVALPRRATRRSRTLIDGTLKALGAAGKPEVLLSLLGRVAARNLEAKVVADQMVVWLNELIEAIKGGDAKFFTPIETAEGSGAGLWEAPRGALGHWMTVKGGKIAGYQVVTPSTWDMSPARQGRQARPARGGARRRARSRTSRSRWRRCASSTASILESAAGFT